MLTQCPSGEGSPWTRSNTCGRPVWLPVASVRRAGSYGRRLPPANQVAGRTRPVAEWAGDAAAGGGVRPRRSLSWGRGVGLGVGGVPSGAVRGGGGRGRGARGG